MKKIALMLFSLLMIAFVGCAPKTGNSPFGFLQSAANSQTPAKTQLPFLPPAQTTVQTPLPTPTPSSVQTVTNAAMTLNFAFGQKSGTYTGQLANGLPDGKGSFTAADNEGNQWTYVGDWKSGHFQGTGTTTWPADSWVETGTYANDALVSGETYWKGKIAYRGAMSKNRYHGQGKTFDFFGHVIFEGTFDNGYLKEDDEHRITRADMIAPEAFVLTKNNYNSVINNKNNYIGKWVEVAGRVDYFYDEDVSSAYTEIELLVDGASGYYADVYYRYAVGEQRMKMKDGIRVFGVIVDVVSYTGNDGKKYLEPLIEAHVVYIGQ